MSFSESEATDEQQHARILGSGDRTKSLSIRQRRSQARILRMIEGIVRINAEGEGHVLSYRYIPHETEVPHILTRAIERCARGITQSVGRRSRKGFGVEPTLSRT